MLGCAAPWHGFDGFLMPAEIAASSSPTTRNRRSTAAQIPSSSPSSRGLTRLIAFIWVLLIGAILVPVALLGTIAWRSYGAALADAQLLVQRTVDVLHEHVLKVLETEELSLDRISPEIAGRSWKEIEHSPNT